MKTIILCLLLSLTAYAGNKPAPRALPVEPQSNASEAIRVAIPDEGITLILPADWESIPPQILEEYRNALVHSSTNPAEARTNTMGYVFAAQRKGADNHFVFPYLIVDSLNTGRISAAHF